MPPAPLQPSVRPSLPTSHAGVWRWVDGWADRQTDDGWVGLSPCLGIQEQPSYLGNGGKSTSDLSRFEDQGGLGVAGAMAYPGSVLLPIFITWHFLLTNIRPGFGLVPGSGSAIPGLRLQRGFVLWQKTCPLVWQNASAARQLLLSLGGTKNLSILPPVN